MKNTNEINVWDSTVPVELSSYLQDDCVTFYNLEGFSCKSKAPLMLDLFCGAGGFSVGCSWAGFETVFGNADLDFTFGFKDDCSMIRSAASKIAEYTSFDIVDGVVNVELTAPAKFSDVLLRVANTGHLSYGKKLFVFDNLFDTTLDDV